MKKLSLIFIALFVAVFAMAQVTPNTATINQFGSNIGTILQTGSYNDGLIEQGTLATPVNLLTSTGYHQGAYIQQIGDRNSSEISFQRFGGASAITLQTGDENTAFQDLRNGAMYKGLSNPLWGANVTQNGVSGTNSDEGFRNWASQTSLANFGTSGGAGINLVQTGNDNHAEQLAIGGNVPEIFQIGNNNNNSTVNTLDISATGLDNPLELGYTFYNQAGGYTAKGDITQYSNQMGGVAHIRVEGDDNNTFQFQEYHPGGGWGQAGHNQSTLDLIGSRNDVIQGTRGDLNTSDIDIDGHENVVTSSQLGDSNITDVDILGSFNVVGVEQYGNSQNATVFQNGDSNFTSVVQQP